MMKMMQENKKKKKKRHAKKKVQRKAKRADATSNVLWQMKNANTHMF